MTEFVAKNLATSQVKVGPMNCNNSTELGFSARLASIKPVPKTVAWRTSVSVTHLKKNIAFKST